MPDQAAFMETAGKPSTYSYQAVQDEGSDNWTVQVTGRLDRHASAPLLKDLKAFLIFRKPDILTVDLGAVDYFDDFGALVLMEIRELALFEGGKLVISRAGERVRRILDTVDFENLQSCCFQKRKKPFNIFVRLGDLILDETSNLQYMIGFVGGLVLAALYVFRRPRALRMGDVIDNMERTGVQALPIVALISFLLGLIMAFMSSLQLEQFGANIYVASLVALAMVSELGPIMTAIVVSGRSGSAYAAEIGAMKISEEIDALVTMGFDPIVFLAVPKMAAALVVIPILTLFSSLFAVSGGLLVGVTMLDLTVSSYMTQTLETLTLFEVGWGMTKSAVFALIIAGIGCMRGFQAKSGAAAVGNAATSAVVTSIFLIILFDSIFAVIRSLW